MAKKFYLVTGGTGFIGSAIARRLLARGYGVRVLDNDFRGSAGKLKDLSDDLELFEADIRDTQAVLNAARGVDGIIHLAFINGTRYFYSDPELVLEVGVKGMINVLDACRRHGIGELVLASSSEVYQTPPEVPTPETVPLMVPDPFNPRYSYAGGKIISELMAINYGRKEFERVIIFRPHNVYGPDMGWEHVLPEFVLRMKKLCAENMADPLEFPIQGTGGETRAFVYIEDFTDGLMLVIEKGEHLAIYNIGTQEERTIEEAAVCVGEYFGRGIQIIPGERARGGTPRRCPDIGKIKALGYRPKWKFADGVFELARWYTAHAHLAPPV